MQIRSRVGVVSRYALLKSQTARTPLGKVTADWSWATAEAGAAAVPKRTTNKTRNWTFICRTMKMLSRTTGAALDGGAVVYRCLWFRQIGPKGVE